ncbi:MAG: FAD-dependent oxidoreductase [Chthoniobacteraceae bacterium]
MSALACGGINRPLLMAANPAETAIAADQFDVIVAGGGPAGIVAATQAARAGARTLLLEKSGILGGTTILNGVNFPGLFHAWGRQIIAGIGWELVAAAVKEVDTKLPDFSTFRHGSHSRLQILVDRSAYAALADRMVLDSGAALWLHTMLGSVVPASNGGWEVTVCLKEGLKPLRTRVLIDCTGDANAVRMAGLPLTRNPARQPGTLIMRVSGYDLRTLDYEGLERAFVEAVGRGEMQRPDFHAARNPVYSFLHSHGNNAMHVTGVDGETSKGKTEAEVAARAAMQRIFQFLRKQPGMKNLRIDQFATECGIRETTSIVGGTRITRADYCSGRVWPDSLCYSFYPIDVHAPDGIGIDTRPLKEGVFPTIPLGSLLPQNSRNLLVAGRSACGDQEAQSAFRVQASAMAMGQAAGAAAALAASANREVRQIPLEDIQKLLRHHGAIVPPDIS